MRYRVVLHKRALKDLENLKRAGLNLKVKELLERMSLNPYVTPPAYEKLTGDLNGSYSRRINAQHRLLYAIDEKERIIYVYRMWTYYK